VVHENRGLNPHIEDVARRFALENFMALAPDALAPLGGYPGTEDEARGLFGKLDRPKIAEDMVAAATYLKNRPDSTGKIGVVGFCFGGGIAQMLATRLPDLGAAVSFYGNSPEPEQAKQIEAPMLLHYAGSDQRINASRPAWEAALKEAGVPFESYLYEGTQHGFNNDTTPRFDEAAAKLAWQRTVDFFKKHLA
jgi:carboxymethylenebutenolidase